MSEADRILVAGGGIGGLATGNSLARQGQDVLVLEQADRLTEIGAAIGVQTNAVRALRDMGLADRLLAHGQPIEFYEYYTWRGRRLVQWSQGAIGRKLGEPTVVVHRGDLQRTLLSSFQEAAGEAALQLGSCIEAVEQDSSGVTVTLADGSAVRGAFLVGADGLRSVVRSHVVGPDDLRYSGWVAYRGITTFAHPGAPVGYARQTLGRGRSFGMWHLPGGRLYWVGTISEPAGGDVAPGGRRQHVLDNFGSAHSPIRELVEATDTNVILRNEVHDRVPVASWSKDRVTLLGDAAHPTTPVTGQGGGQAMIDASVLGRELAAADIKDPASVRAATQAYEARRNPVTTSITNEAWRIAAMHHWGNPVAAAVRDLSLRLTPGRVWDSRMEERLAF